MTFAIIHKVWEIRNLGLFNVILLGLSYGLLQTSLPGNALQMVLKSIELEDANFIADWFVYLSVAQLTFALVIVFSPMAIDLMGLRTTLILCACMHPIFISHLLLPKVWSMYVLSVFLGIAAAFSSTARGNYLTVCSTKGTVRRNMGIFIVIVNCSQFVGNAIVFLTLFGRKEIDSNRRTLLLSVLISIAVLAVLGMVCLKAMQNKVSSLVKGETGGTNVEALKTIPRLESLKEVVRVLGERRLMFLIPSFMCLGIMQAFLNTVCPTAIGFTNSLGESSKSLVGLFGIVSGAGGLVGGGIFLGLGHLNKILEKQWVECGTLLLAFLFMFFGYATTFINIPHDAPFKETDDIAYLNPASPTVGMISAAFLGIGLAIYTAQVSTKLSSWYPNKSAAAFANLNFFQAVSSSGMLFFSSKMGLIHQLICIVLASLIAIGTYAFITVKGKVSGGNRDSPQQRTQIA